MKTPRARVPAPSSSIKNSPRGLAVLGAVLLAITLPLSACGEKDSAAGRPTVDQINSALTDGPFGDELGLKDAGVPDRVFTCIAQKIEDSKLSDAALQALVDGDKGYQPSDTDQNAISGLQSQILTCAG